MAKYEGQPEYVVAGYLSDLFVNWTENLGNDEWGEYMNALGEASKVCVGLNDERALVIAEWIQEELQAAWDNDWGGVFYTYEDWKPIYGAQDEYETITRYWIRRARDFSSLEALETVINNLPEWVRPMPDRLEKPDPERETYERLKAKFEGGS